MNIKLEDLPMITTCALRESRLKNGASFKRPPPQLGNHWMNTSSLSG